MARCGTCGLVRHVLMFGNGGGEKAPTDKGITATRVQNPVHVLECAKCGEKGYLMLFMIPAPPAPQLTPSEIKET